MGVLITQNANTQGILYKQAIYHKTIGTLILRNIRARIQKPFKNHPEVCGHLFDM